MNEGTLVGGTEHRNKRVTVYDLSEEGKSRRGMARTRYRRERVIV